MNNKVSINELSEVLKEFNNEKYFKYTNVELQYRGIVNGRFVYIFLLENNYIDKNRRLIKTVDLTDIKEIEKQLTAFKKINKTPKLIRSNKQLPLKNYSDVEIVTELRERGYNISANKTIEL